MRSYFGFFSFFFHFLFLRKCYISIFIFVGMCMYVACLIEKSRAFIGCVEVSDLVELVD